MPMGLEHIAPAAGRAAATGVAEGVARGAASPAGAGFAEALGHLIDGVDRAGAASNTAVANMLDGSGEVHDAMIALQNAEMALELTVQVRNKLVQAYQDIMRMPI